MISNPRHGSPPRLMAHQPNRSPTTQESSIRVLRPEPVLPVQKSVLEHRASLNARAPLEGERTGPLTQPHAGVNRVRIPVAPPWSDRHSHFTATASIAGWTDPDPLKGVDGGTKGWYKRPDRSVGNPLRLLAFLQQVDGPPSPPGLLRAQHFQ